MEAVTPEGERVDNEINKPVNILEEIVWYKDVELQQRKEKFPLELVRTALQNAPPPATSWAPSAPSSRRRASPRSSPR